MPTESNVADTGTKGLTCDRILETDDSGGNEFGCWGGVSCAAVNGENHGEVDFSTVMQIAKRETVNVVLKAWKRMTVWDMKAADLQLWRGLRAMALTTVVPMMWKSPGPSRDNENVGRREIATRQEQQSDQLLSVEKNWRGMA